MSIFASQTHSDPILIPFDPPHTFVVRKLTGLEIDAAQEAHRGTIASGSTRSWATLFRRAMVTGASDPDVLKAIGDPLTGYDRYALVRLGLVAWSYPQPIAVPAEADGADSAAKAARATMVATRQAAIDDLDDEAVDFIATEVLRLTKPALFLTTEEDVAAAQKKLSAAAPAA